MKKFNLFTAIFATAMIAMTVSCTKSEPTASNYFLTDTERTEVGSAIYTKAALTDAASSITLKPVTAAKLDGTNYDVEYVILFEAAKVNTVFDMNDGWVNSVGKKNYINFVAPIAMVSGDLKVKYPAGTYSKNCKSKGNVTFRYNKDAGTIEFKVANSAISIYDDNNKFLGDICVDCNYSGPATVK